MDAGHAVVRTERLRLRLVTEAARGVMAHARAHGIARIAAFTAPANTASIALLLHLSMRFERLAVLVPAQPAVNVCLADLAPARDG